MHTNTTDREHNLNSSMVRRQSMIDGICCQLHATHKTSVNLVLIKGEKRNNLLRFKLNICLQAHNVFVIGTGKLRNTIGNVH